MPREQARLLGQAKRPDLLHEAARLVRCRFRRLYFEPLEDRCLLSASPSGSQSVDTSLTPQQVADEMSVANSINAFAADLYGQLQQQNPGNLVFSPFSIATALAMTYAGAQGATAAQMAAVLHLTLDPNDVAAGFGALLADLNAAGAAGNFSLNAADALWAQQGFPINSQFLNVVQSNYGGGVNQVDYINDAEAARQTINTWVANETNQKIQNLIPEGQLDSLTRLVLTNAVYFKDAWASPFNPGQTSDAEFTLPSGGEELASTMHQVGYFQYAEVDGNQVLELPYADGRLSMVLVLPNGSGSSPLDLDAALVSLSSQYVDISLPKFEFTTTSPLNGPLSALGMTDALSQADADFSGIVSQTIAQFYISNVDHKAYIDVDEAGTEAAAATAVGISTAGIVFNPGTPIQFNADHPFEFMIRDNQTGAILFEGQVANPDPSAVQTPPQPGATPPPGLAPPTVDPTMVTPPVTSNPGSQQPAPATPISAGPGNSPAPVTSNPIASDSQSFPTMPAELPNSVSLVQGLGLGANPPSSAAASSTPANPGSTSTLVVGGLSTFVAVAPSAASNPGSGNAATPIVTTAAANSSTVSERIDNSDYDPTADLVIATDLPAHDGSTAPPSSNSSPAAAGAVYWPLND